MVAVGRGGRRRRGEWIWATQNVTAAVANGAAAAISTRSFGWRRGVLPSKETSLHSNEGVGETLVLLLPERGSNINALYNDLSFLPLPLVALGRLTSLHWSMGHCNLMRRIVSANPN